MTVALFIGLVTIGHLLAYAIFVYWSSRLKASGNVADGEIIDHTWDGNLREQNSPIPGWVLALFYIMIVVGSLYLLLVPGIFGKEWNGLLNATQVDDYNKQSQIEEARSADYFSLYESKSIEELAQMPEALSAGRRIFLHNCAVCHASDAAGTPGHYPNLADHDWLWGGSPEQILATITNGRNTIVGQGMPAGGALADTSEEAVAAVSEYVLQLGGKPVDNALAERGKPLYDASCVACHAADGTGNVLLGAPNIVDNIWLYTDVSEDDVDGLRAYMPGQILHPKNNMMPAWKGTLSDARIKVVAAYVYSLSQPQAGK